jgi:hypothetical protein
MANLMQRAAGWLIDKLQDSAGREIVYRQGAAVMREMIGVPAEESYKVSGSDGTFTWFRSTDWLLSTDGLLEITPRPGDQITETLNGIERIYQVLPISDDEPCWRQADNSNVFLVVHTQRIK